MYQSRQLSGLVSKFLLAKVTSRNHHVCMPLPYIIEDSMGNFLLHAMLKAIAEEYQQGLNKQINGSLLLQMFSTQHISHEARKQS
jgi:hypothetical protein